MSVSRIIRTIGSAQQTEEYLWDREPVPLEISHVGADPTAQVAATAIAAREDLSHGAFALMGSGLTRIYELAAGWPCRITQLHESGHLRWSTQTLVSPTTMLNTVLLKSPDEESAAIQRLSYEVGAGFVTGGSDLAGHTTIRRTSAGLFLVFESAELGVKRTFLLTPEGLDTVMISEISDAKTPLPHVTATATDTEALRKTVRWLVLEMTNLVVPEGLIELSGLGP